MTDSMSDKSKYVIAMHEDSNANAVLFGAEGEVLFAVAEERLSRIKFDGGFPRRCLAEIEARFGVSIKDVEAVICGNRCHFYARIMGDKFEAGEHDFLGWPQKAILYFNHGLARSATMRAAVEAFIRVILRRRLGRDFSLVDHHLAHAYSAFFTSGKEAAVAVTADNFGDGMSAGVYRCESNRCKFLYGSTSIDSPGQFYGEICQAIGIHPLQAGKMTGLAAYGDPEKAYPIMAGLFALTADKRSFKCPPMLWKSWRRGPYKALKDFSKEEVAAAAQKRFEDVMVEFALHAGEETGMRNLVLAGGAFGNVKANQRIHETGKFDFIFVHPAMSDQGIAMGAGFLYLAEKRGLKPFLPDSVFYGPSFSEAEIEAALKSEGVEYGKHDDIEKTMAALLAEGRVVARFNGAMEYGPRALGNRSIHYRTTDPSVNDWLNKRLKRTEYMPFAPVTLWERRHECYENIDPIADACRFMTVSVNATEAMKKASPGVIHIDGTVRPQLIREQDNPSCYRMVSEYQKLTGIPCVINTSFNMHQEPIVCTPKEAVRTFKLGHLDCLAIGPFLVK